MTHLDYYKFQAQARGMHSVDDVLRLARDRAYLYDRIVLPWLPADRTRPVAELACGHGTFLAWLHARGFQRIAGSDSSPVQIALARQLGGGIAIEQADVNEWLARQPAGSWHAIAGIDLVEHLPKDEFMSLLAASRRALAPGGRLILRLPNGDSPLVGLNLFNDITHVWTYTSNCLRSLSQMHGFAAIHFTDESLDAIRDQRWLKVPLARLSQAVLGALFQAVAKERPASWSPHLWAMLTA